jgi:DNA-nicking Smr family endonuclease
MVREYLAAHPAVASHSHPPQQRGGTGVTEAELE